MSQVNCNLTDHQFR